MSLFLNNQKYLEFKHNKEIDFENRIFENHKMLFGSKTLYIEKKKLETKIGNTIPDGFLFDFSNPNEPEFYIVEVELAKHSFYGHIFPQVTKFFSFLKNKNDKSSLIDKIYSIIDQSDQYKKEIRKYANHEELYKFIKDIIENSSNILLVIDNKKAEIDEASRIYSDTWGHSLKTLIVKEYCAGKQSIFTTTPDFETLEISDNYDQEEETIETTDYDENYHLQSSNEMVKDVFQTIKEKFKDLSRGGPKNSDSVLSY